MNDIAALRHSRSLRPIRCCVYRYRAGVTFPGSDRRAPAPCHHPGTSRDHQELGAFHQGFCHLFRAVVTGGGRSAWLVTGHRSAGAALMSAGGSGVAVADCSVGASPDKARAAITPHLVFIAVALVLVGRRSPAKSTPRRADAGPVP